MTVHLDLDANAIALIGAAVSTVLGVAGKVIHYLHAGWKQSDADKLALADKYTDELRDFERVLREEGVRKIAQLEAQLAEKIREETARRLPPPSRRKPR